MADRAQILVAVGPALPGIGSWEWIGEDLAAALPERFNVTTFDREIPPADVVLIANGDLQRIVPRVLQHVPIVYWPIDACGSAAEIDRDWELLRRCSRIILHAENLRPYFQSYRPVEYLDHHIRFAAPLRKEPVSDGPILWVGHRSDLPPLVNWVNRHPLPAPLVVLTNLDGQQAGIADPEAYRECCRIVLPLAGPTPEPSGDEGESAREVEVSAEQVVVELVQAETVNTRFTSIDRSTFATAHESSSPSRAR